MHLLGGTAFHIRSPEIFFGLLTQQSPTVTDRLIHGQYVFAYQIVYVEVPL